MGEIVNGNGSEEIKPEPQLPRLVIQMEQDGSIVVGGTMQDKVLAYGMLESAKEAIKLFHDNQNKIHPVKGGLINHLRRFK